MRSDLQRLVDEFARELEKFDYAMRDMARAVAEKARELADACKASGVVLTEGEMDKFYALEDREKRMCGWADFFSQVGDVPCAICRGLTVYRERDAYSLEAELEIEDLYDALIATAKKISRICATYDQVSDEHGAICDKVKELLEWNKGLIRRRAEEREDED